MGSLRTLNVYFRIFSKRGLYRPLSKEQKKKKKHCENKWFKHEGEKVLEDFSEY